MSVGITELKEALLFVINLAEGVDKAMEDGSPGLADVIHLYPALQSAPNAFKGAQNIPDEISDLTDEEFEELSEYIQNEFDINDDELEEFVEYAVATLINIVLLINKFKELRGEDTQG